MRYNRKLFDYDSTRARAYLINQAKGVLLDVYNGRIVTKFDAEHIFPLKSAWEQGFKDMYAANKTLALKKMRKFANDPRNLVICLLYTSPSPRDRTRSRMPSSA